MDSFCLILFLSRHSQATNLTDNVGGGPAWTTDKGQKNSTEIALIITSFLLHHSLLHHSLLHHSGPCLTLGLDTGSLILFEADISPVVDITTRLFPLK